MKKFSLLFLVIISCCTLSGCSHWSPESRAYGQYHSYWDQNLETVSEGWILISNTSDKIKLNTPRALNDPLEVVHHLKVWWNPKNNLLMALNNYTQFVDLTLSVNYFQAGYVVGGRQADMVVGQSVLLLDLMKNIGMVQYNNYFNEVIMQGNGIVAANKLHIYSGVDDFYSNTNIKNILFRENCLPNSKLKAAFESDDSMSLEQQYEWFTFNADSWTPFLAAAKTNGNDEDKWKKWSVNNFFIKDLQLHLPGIYVATDGGSVTRVGATFIRPLLFSKDLGAFARTTDKLPEKVKADLNRYRKNVNVHAPVRTTSDIIKLKYITADNKDVWLKPLMEGQNTNNLYYRIVELLWLRNI